jgi:hypothetical protein
VPRNIQWKTTSFDEAVLANMPKGVELRKAEVIRAKYGTALYTPTDGQRIADSLARLRRGGTVKHMSFGRWMRV